MNNSFKKLFTNYYTFIKEYIKEERLFWIVILTLLILFFSYSYVEAYFDKAIDFVNEKVLGIKTEDQVISSSPTPNPSPKVYKKLKLSPKPTPKVVKYKTNNPTVDSDPPIHCNIGPNCGGGTIPLKKSECDNSTCCQIGNQWIFYKDRNKCTEDQKKNQPTYNYPTYDYPTYSPIPLPSYEPYVYEPYVQPPPTEGEIEAEIYRINKIIEQCKSDVRWEYQGKIQSCNQYSGSAREACIETLTKEQERELKKCES